MDTCICTAEFLHCSPETIITLFVNWLYPKTKFKKNFFFIQVSKRRGKRRVSSLVKEVSLISSVIHNFQCNTIEKQVKFLKKLLRNTNLYPRLNELCQDIQFMSLIPLKMQLRPQIDMRIFEGRNKLEGKKIFYVLFNLTFFSHCLELSRPSRSSTGFMCLSLKRAIFLT